MGQEKPKKGNYAVIFISKLNPEANGFKDLNELAYNEALSINGFIKEVSARNTDNNGVSVSFWESKEAIEEWRNNAVHQMAKERGKANYLESYEIYITEIK
jgi:heme-degrading monooxygenase HmoA